MSVWADLHKRSTGETVRKEDDPTPLIKDFFSKLSSKVDNYTINPDYTVDVEGNVHLVSSDLKDYDGKLPFKFNRVTGSFGCGYGTFKSFWGCPKEVGTYVWICGCEGGTLEGSFQKVGSFIKLYATKLTSLEGLQDVINGDFAVHGILTSLKGCPSFVKGDFDCSGNELTSLEGCPKEVTRDFYCEKNKKLFSTYDVKKYCKVGGRCHFKSRW